MIFVILLVMMILSVNDACEMINKKNGPAFLSGCLVYKYNI